jgi:hypothetical protein
LNKRAVNKRYEMPFLLDYRHYRKKKMKRRSKPMMSCPTEGCYGWGNTNSDHLWHYSQQSCPLSDGNVMTVRIGNKDKLNHKKAIKLSLDSPQIPQSVDSQQVWHYFLIMKGEGSAQLKVFRNKDINNDQKQVLISGQLIDQNVLESQISQEIDSQLHEEVVDKAFREVPEVPPIEEPLIDKELTEEVVFDNKKMIYISFDK